MSHSQEIEGYTIAADDKLEEAGWGTVGADAAEVGERGLSGYPLTFFSNCVDELYIQTNNDIIFKSI